MRKMKTIDKEERKERETRQRGLRKEWTLHYHCFKHTKYNKKTSAPSLHSQTKQVEHF